MKKLNFVFALIASTLIAGSCDDGTVVGTSTAGAAGGPGGSTVSMGFGTGAGFQPDIIGIGVSNLAAGGSTSMTVNFVFSDGTLFTDPVDVTFSSPCIAASTALVAVNPVTAANGQADGSYAASGCSGADVVTATASVLGTVLTATGTITVAPATVGSIQFISATPELIGLSGTGGQGISETSTVIFRVVDSTGGPVAGTDVDFSLSTSVGGITLTPTTATSDASGNAQTVVNSGTVATSVRVNADVVGATPAIGTQSSVLVVSTGLPDQDSFSWAVQCPNIEAWAYNGVENDITVQLADRFQNPVPDGTAVSFTAEGGSVESNCLTMTNATQSGFCTATWTSADPRPADGRVTVLATAIGEESFIDFDGNGTFDGAPDTFTDLAEQFRDDNEIDSDAINGNYDAGEFFLDFDQTGTYGTGDGLFNGLLCQPAPGSGECSTSQTTGIGSSGVIIMSGSTAFIVDDVGGTLAAPGTVTFTIGDLHSQPMPAGTDVKFTANNGSIVGPSSLPVPCTSFNGPLGFSFFVDADSTSDSGAGVLEVTTPGPGVGGAAGVTTVYFITITD